MHRIQQSPVIAVEHSLADGGDINRRGTHIGMAQAQPLYAVGHADALALGGPGVADHVRRELTADADLTAQAGQGAVIAGQRQGVVFGIIIIHQREDILTVAVAVAPQDGQGLGLQADGDSDAGLTAAVRQVAAADLAPSEMGHIDERHAADIEAELAYIGGQPQAVVSGAGGEQAFHLPQLQGALTGLLVTREHAAEGVALGRKPLIDSAVEQGLQGAQVGAAGVTAQAPVEQPLLVVLHELPVEVA